MSPRSTHLTKAECLVTLRRAGYPESVVADVDAALPDPIDTERDAPILARFGITAGTLMDRLGGSP